ncbi:MAG: succinyl-diaminopimelate desuccinylase [Planctomycetes bacterium]|nr:succinyl-diaminopimelate desuccinylase [Planctomycetota bacterium]
MGAGDSEGGTAALGTELGEELARRLLELAAIPSVSRDEKALCDWLEARLRAVAGRAVLRTGDNLVVTLPALSARADAPLVVFCGHLDTVPVNGNLPPRRDGDTIHGLGTSDLKSGLAVLWKLLDQLSALLARDPAAAARLPCRPAFVFYAREEIAYAESGLIEVARDWPELARAAFAICVEPTSNAVELGCLGTMHAELTVRGKAAHAARPWLGKNAIHAAAPLLQKVAERGERRWSPPGRPDLDYREVMSITGISGGKAKNVVPDTCVMNLNFRFAPDRSADDARAQVAALAEGFAEVVFKDLAPAGRVATGNPSCDRLVALAGAVRAKQAWTDVGRFSAMGLDAVSCGPGAPEFAHQQAEQASIAKMVESLALFRAFLGLAVEPA